MHNKTLIVLLTLVSAACSPSSSRIGGPVPVSQFMPLARADFERMSMLGAGCTWRAGPGTPVMLVLKDTGGAVKIDGADVALDPDVATPVLDDNAYGVRQTYRSASLAIEIRRAEGDWTVTGPETREVAAELLVRTGEGGEALRPGILSCGA